MQGSHRGDASAAAQAGISADPAGAAISRGLCPACRTEFQGSQRCLQCGLDLTPVMRLEIEAHRLRKAARLALAENRLDAADEAATDSLRLFATDEARRILHIVALLRAAACAAADPIDDETQDEVSTEVAFSLLDYATQQASESAAEPADAVADILVPENLAQSAGGALVEERLPEVRDVSAVGVWGRLKGLLGRGWFGRRRRRRRD